METPEGQAEDEVGPGRRDVVEGDAGGVVVAGDVAVLDAEFVGLGVEPVGGAVGVAFNSNWGNASRSPIYYFKPNFNNYLFCLLFYQPYYFNKLRQTN